jgi:hypothetical protein
VSFVVDEFIVPYLIFFYLFPEASSAIIVCAPYLHHFSITI